MEKETNISKKEANKIIDDYFNDFENKIMGMVKEIFALTLKTADDQNLEFPEDIQEASQIEEGTGPVKVDGKNADGEYIMPDGVTLVIKQGYVEKIIQPAPEEIAAKMRAEMQEFRRQIKAHIGETIRKPFKK